MNRREFVSRLTAATALAGMAPLAEAADGRRVALVIGNGAYRNVPALLNPPNDASDVAAALKRLGFAVSLATNASFDAMGDGTGSIRGIEGVPSGHSMIRDAFGKSTTLAGRAL